MYDVFKQHLAALHDISQKVITNDNFVKIQRIQAAIVGDYNDGKLSDTEKRSLNAVAEVVINSMRKELIHNRNNGRR